MFATTIDSTTGKTHYFLEGEEIPSVGDLLRWAMPYNSDLKKQTPSQLRKQQERMERGRIIHAAIADYFRGQDLSLPECYGGWFTVISDFLAKLPSGYQVSQIEQPLCNFKYRYGGTPDLGLIFPDGLHLFDFKTTAGTWRKTESGKTQYSPHYDWLIEGETEVKWSTVHPNLKRGLLQLAYYKIACDYNKQPVAGLWIIQLCHKPSTHAQYADVSSWQSYQFPAQLWLDCEQQAQEIIESYWQTRNMNPLAI